MNNAPDADEALKAAVKFTSTSFFKTEDISNLGSGNLILYKPDTGETNLPPVTEPEETTTEEQTTKPAETSVSIIPETENYLITQNVTENNEDLSVYNVHSGTIITRTYEANGGENFLNLPSGAQVRNCTTVDNQYLTSEMTIKPDIKIELFSDEPQILIIHTHTSESFQPDSEFYDSSYPARTIDPSKNVVSVGSAIAEQLASAGICVIHDGTSHDYPLYEGSYDRSAETITALTEKYPSIKVVLDIHRDAIEEADGTPVAALTKIDGKNAAQIMIISACGDGYYYVPDYIKNFHLACALQDKIESDWKGLTRPVLFDYCQYNEHLSPGSLLIEIGSHGNTLEEAIYSGKLFGQAVAELLTELSDS